MTTRLIERSGDGPRAALRVVPDSDSIDVPAARRAVADLLTALGHDVDSDHPAETPRRVVEAYAELLSPEPFQLTTFPNDEGYPPRIR